MRTRLPATVVITTCFALAQLSAGDQPRRAGTLHKDDVAIEYGVAVLKFSGTRYAKQTVRFANTYVHRPVVIASESGTAGTFLMVKAENIKQQGCDIVAWSVAPLKEYTAEIGFAVFGRTLANKANSVGSTLLQEEDRLSYVVVEDKTYDLGVIKAEVDLSIVVTGTLTEKTLREALLEVFSHVGKRTGYKYHAHPTTIYIDTYLSREHAAGKGGTWIAQLRWIETENKEPLITIERERISRLRDASKSRFGLSDRQRKLVFKEIILVEVQADIDAQKAIPSPDRRDQRVEHKRRLLNTYKRTLAEKHGLTLDQLSEIGVEGVANGWPNPANVPELPQE